jgi:hypothetical protein
MTSRRKFLKQGTLGALVAGFAFGAGKNTLGASSGPADLPFDLNRAAFASQLQTTFVVTDGKKKIPLKLINVLDRGSRKTMTRDREAFTVVLRGGNSSPLRQQTYDIEHEKLGSFTLLLVPVSARDTNARYYEININRLHG